MSKILIIGHNPPHLGAHSRIEAANYRTGQFLEPLLDDGNTISLCVIRSRKKIPDPSVAVELPERFHYHSIPVDRIWWQRKLQRIHDAFKPACIVAVNFDACLYATRLHTNRPIWMDIYGDYLTIIQAACHRAQSDRGLATSIGFIRQVLRRGDKYSVCSTPQSHALVGELAVAGRLNWRTFGYQFTHVIRPGAITLPDKGLGNKERKKLRSRGIDGDDFVVLWCGGYNTWTDIRTLFTALEWTMTKDPRIHFVSLGANTYQAKDNIYHEYLSLIEQSEFRERFHMMGWRPWKEVAEYYHESDVGLNIDAMHYETIYGTRTRLVEMMAAGLPVITSLGSELSYLLRDQGLALTFEVGNWEELGNRILSFSRDRKKMNSVAINALTYTDTKLSLYETTKQLRDWVKDPKKAPDRYTRSTQEEYKCLEHQARAVLRQFLWHVAGLDK